MDGGFIKIDRGILDWEWYSDINTTRLFIHLILKANWKDGRFQGQEIKRGSFVTSYPKLAEETELTVNQVRTSLSKLKSTGEITVKSQSKFSVITVKNYCLYQDISQANHSQITDKPQTNHSQITTIEESKKVRREEIKKRVSKDTPKETPEDIISQYDFSEAMVIKIREWLKYKSERRETYKSTGLTALLNRVSQKSGEYGENPVMALMDESMANGWRGIIWDRLKGEEKHELSGKGKWDEYLQDGLNV
nr:MAG TPA: replisome organizer [Caudoviricetes sp.]